MSGDALGVIETVGMAAAIEAADICLKSANVELIGYELSKGMGLITVKIRGDVGAIKAALEAAKIGAAKVNSVYGTLIIPRPAKGINGIIESDLTVGVKLESNDEIVEKNIEEEIPEEVKEDIEEEVQEEIEDDIEEEIQEDIETEEKLSDKDLCNLCHDPSCPRRKGQPRNLCSHYKSK